MSALAGTLSCVAAIPQTQNTAPVLEFRCLYTSDIRRKQKRWQDGRLKFHTFNKRIMVYDDRSNFVADSHWREDHAFQEGEELEMDRCGMLVQVCEFVGTREQDLTGLFNRAVNDKQRASNVVAIGSSPLRPRELDFPNQEVNMQRSEATGLTSAKRRKTNNFPSNSNGYAQSLTGATLSFSTARSAKPFPRYNPPLSSLKSSVENNYKSHSDGRSSGANISQARISNQTQRVPKGLSSARSDSSYPERIPGAVLVLANRTPTNCRPAPVPGKTEDSTPPLNSSGQILTTNEDDEFIDIDIYDKTVLSPETAFTSASELTGLDKTDQEKLLPKLLTEKPRSSGENPERPSNPLRIRARPKTKLLSASTPLSRASSFTENCLGSELGDPITANIGYEMDPSITRVPKATLVTETEPCVNERSLLSSPVSAGIDHHGIDKMLARKSSGETRVDKSQHGNMRGGTQNKRPLQSVMEMKEATGLNGRDAVLSNHIPHLQPERYHEDFEDKRQSLRSFGNIDIEAEKGSSNISIPPRSPPRSMQPSDVTPAIVAEDFKAIRHASHSNRNLAAKRDMIPFKLPTNLNRSVGQITTKPRNDDKQDSDDKNGASNLVANTECAVLVSKVKLVHIDRVASNAQGPWTREAFDLFDWRPKAGTIGDTLNVG